MNITEFLLARIAEDEQMAGMLRDGPVAIYDDGNLIAIDAEDVWSDGEQRVPNRHMGYWVMNPAARALAECKAKRLMIEDCEQIDRDGDGEVWFDMQALLVHMSRPYLDHPDYREEWRP